MTALEDYFIYARDYWHKIAVGCHGAITPGPQWDDAERDATELLVGIDGNRLMESTVVEVGSGEGRLAGPLSLRCKKYIGLDITPVCVERAEALGLHRAKAEFRVMTSLADIVTAKPDIVVSYTVFQHLPEKILNDMLASIHGSLPPGGLISFQLDSIGRLPQYRYDQVPDEDLWNSRWYPDDYLADKLKMCGFTVLRQSTRHNSAWLARK